MSYIDRLIQNARRSGELDKSYLDRIIDEDEYAAQEESRPVGKMRSAASLAARSAGEYIDAAQRFGIAKDISHHTNAESPIESALAFALTAFSDVRVEPKKCFDISEAVKIAEKSEEDVNLFQQMFVLKYRLDFLITLRVKEEIKLLCVEADGREYHHANMDQVIRDNARSAEMTMFNIHVLRFTGREIYYEIERCIYTVQRILQAWGAEKRG